MTALRQAVVVLGVGVAVLLASGAFGATAAQAVVAQAAGAATATTGPSLSIAIDNGHTSTKVGDVLTYTITVHNLGTAAVDGLFLSQSLPAGLQFRSADPVADVGVRTIGWKVDLLVGATSTLHSTSVVTATAPDQLRLASVACASTSATGAPIVCASHSDELPAGAAATAAAAARNAPAPAPSRSWVPWVAGVGLVLALAAGAVLGARRRRQD